MTAAAERFHDKLNINLSVRPCGDIDYARCFKEHKGSSYALNIEHFISRLRSNKADIPAFKVGKRDCKAALINMRIIYYAVAQMENIHIVCKELFDLQRTCQPRSEICGGLKSPDACPDNEVPCIERYAGKERFGRKFINKRRRVNIFAQLGNHLAR